MAAGSGNVKMEVLKYGGRKLIMFIKVMFNKIEGEDIPPDWNLSYISSIYKKRDKKLTNYYSRISVIPSVAWLVMTVLKEKIEQQQQIDNFNEEQCGFLKKRSCLVNIFNGR